MADVQPKPRSRKKKHGAAYKYLSFIIICATLIFGISIFFRVSKIEVEGTSIYTTDEVIEASGISKGDNLFFVDRFTAISKIFSKLPYVEEVGIIRSLPNKLVIKISEGAALAYIDVNGKLWTIDRGCKFLGNISESEASELIRIDGIAPEAPAAGEIIKTDISEISKIEFLSVVLREMAAKEMCRDVTEIDMSNISSPEFEYLGRFTVRIGKNENIDYKFDMLLGSVRRLASGDTGIIDLSADKKVHFSPN
ncbi:MAG: FtsQ-type POTRA domain-containing protein [Oscillospiraceae bacterium]|nr:FtsQ-type POTRA domain-containing protein [Oscillospiraceae bacterium]